MTVLGHVRVFVALMADFGHLFGAFMILLGEVGRRKLVLNEISFHRC
jgi:hypothetical protein